jgi:hypothetical protein
MKATNWLLCLVVFLMTTGVYAQSELISRIPNNSVGKLKASIHSYSSQTGWGEGAYNLLLSDPQIKWCDNTTAQPWVIVELLDYYNVDKFVITDCHPFESTKGNFAAYQIFVTDKAPSPVTKDWSDGDWVKVVDKTGVGDLDVKKDSLLTPQKARYVKLLIPDKGLRPVELTVENAIRIYGFDIYGTPAGKIDRSNLISVGKTILSYYKSENVRETAINLLDGNITNVANKWCFYAPKDEEPFRYAVIDLEKQYDINQFILYDCETLESNKNLYGCNIYVSDVAPNINLITPAGDTNTCWRQVVNSDGEDYESTKTYSISSTKGRFVKLEIPIEKIINNETTRLFQFEVYGTEAVIANNDATLSLLSVPEGIMEPSFSASTLSYTVNVVKEAETATIVADATHSEAVVTGAGVKDLVIRSNPFTVTVTAKDQLTTQTYQLNIVRADKSKIASLQSLTFSKGYASSAFASDKYAYDVDVPYGTSSITFSAVATSAEAQVEGTGAKTLSSSVNEFEITVTAEDGRTSEIYTVTVYVAPQGLISVSDPSGKGKRIVNIHSYSGKANDTENAYKLLIGERRNTNGDKGNKWCENDNNQRDPWVIFSLTDIYSIDRIEFRDCTLMGDNGRNVPEYTVYVSTTGTEEDDWEEALWKGDVSGDDTKVGDLNGIEARYIKFVPHKDDATHGVWIYGFDIYGTFSRKVDRQGVVSVGKTIVGDHNHYSDRETPANIIDGNITWGKPGIDEITGDDVLIPVKSDPWAFNRAAGDGWVIIDLEGTYDITKFAVYDTEDWISGYIVSLSADGIEWEQVSDKADFEQEEDPKVATLDETKRGRYVKLELPIAYQGVNFNRIREFEVYGTFVGGAGLNEIKLAGGKLEVAPNPVTRGELLQMNIAGVLKVYSLQGSLIQQQALAEGETVSTAPLAQGYYIVQVTNETGTYQAKLIVK